MTATFEAAIEEFPSLSMVHASPDKVVNLASYLRLVRDTDSSQLAIELAAIDVVWGSKSDPAQAAAFNMNQRLGRILFDWDSTVLANASDTLSDEAVATWKRLATRLRATADQIEGVLIR